jgi:hypothetical protein
MPSGAPRHAETVKTLRPGIGVRLRSANRVSSCGCVHGAAIRGVRCARRLGRRTTHVQRFAVRHRLPSNEAILEAGRRL